MPVTKEILIERIRYLRDVQRSLEGVAKEVVVIAVAGPVINLVIRSPYVFLAITLAVIATLAAVLAALIRIQSEISS